MKHLRASARVDPDDAPAFFNLLAHSEEVEEARILDVNTSIEGVETFLFAIDGDPTAFAAGAGDTPGVQSVEVTETDLTTYALVVADPMNTPLFASIHSGTPQSGMVLRTPIVYRDGEMRGHVVGNPDDLQTGLDAAPDALDVSIEEIGEFRGDPGDPQATLTDRQREALDAALELGYYDQPREATQADVAAELGCAPQTANDHLRKAEAKAVRAVMDDIGPQL